MNIRHTIIVLSLAFLWAPTNAEAFDEAYGGYAATVGALAFATTAPVARMGTAHLLTPECETCSPGFWQYAAATGVVFVAVAATVGIGWLGGAMAQNLDLGQDVGWAAAGVTVGIPTFGALYVSAPRFGPDWAYNVAGLGVLAGGATLNGWHFVRVAQGRGNAWAEFGMGQGGMVVGGVLGAVACGGESCFGIPLGVGLGGLVGVATATAIFGFQTGDTSTRAMPLMRLRF